jgi:hypothetical protein
MPSSSAARVGYHLLIERFQAAPLMISKLNTFMQLTLVLVIVANHGIMPATDVAAGWFDRPDHADHRLERRGLRLALGPSTPGASVQPSI